MSDADTALSISNFLALYWDEMEKNHGKDMADFLTEDSVYEIPGVRLEGRDKICTVSAQRAAAIPSVARHLMTNLRFDFSRLQADGQASIYGIMTFFGGVGTGVLPVQLPMAVYDFVFHVRNGGKHGWLVSHTLYETVFVRQDDDMKKYAGNIDALKK